jgi:membrane-bound serine protease (ClpP class)
VAPAFAAPADAKDGPWRRIHVIDFEGEIEPALAAYVKRRLDEAVAAKADAIVLRIESPGGRVDSSMEIADAILDLQRTIRSVAWVPKEAYSGASMAALACDEIVMGPSAKIGDCQPILMGPDGIKPVGEKVETVLRAAFRRFAEDNGWPPLLAEKMVSQDLEVVEVQAGDRRFYVTGAEFDSARDDDLVGGVRKADLVRVGTVLAKGRLLTMTASEAVKLGFVHRIFDTERAFFTAIAAPDAEVVQVRMTWMEGASRWLLGVTGVLAALILLCAGLTVFQGVGLSTIVGGAALALTLLVVLTADLAYGFPLLLVAVGLALLAAEAFLLPGFGVAGILGILSVGTGFLLLGASGSPGGPGPTLAWDDIGDFVLQFSATIVVGAAVFVALSRIFPSLPIANRHLLLRAGSLGAGPAVLPTDVYPEVGAVGTADTALRPAGRAVVGGRLVDVTSEGEFVEAGAPLRVVRVEGGRVVVRPGGTGART